MPRTRTARPPLRALLALVLLAGLLQAPARAQQSCPTTIDRTELASEEQFREWNELLADLGPRPTASSPHERYIDWLERRLKRLPGIEISSLDETIDRQLEQRTTLKVTDAAGVRHDVPVSGPVPYSEPGTASGLLLYLPRETAIGPEHAGKVVVRDVPSGVIPMSVFFAVAWYVHDTEASFDYTGNYERDWAAAVQRVDDLKAAQEHGLAGIVFVHGLPREQVSGHYAPYTGDHWDVTAAYVGADEGEQLKQWDGAEATLTLRASRGPAKTRTLIGRLEGQSHERIVIESHTDGMNAVWDNGPVAILALAEYFSELPLECRPRSLEFVFTTAHLYLTHAGAHRYAEMLDETYDEGDTAFVVAIEHLGAMEYEAMPRQDGGPGRELVRTGNSELFATFASESPVLVPTLINRIQAHDLQRTWVLRGADAPAVRFPPHQSYGGEGGPYREHLIPTVAGITGPWTLFNPAFGMELVDVELMRRQTLAFGDLVLMLDDVPREVIAGADTAYRIGRDATGL